MGEQKKNNITLKVGGMSCASCVAHIEEALKDLKGVSRAQVNLAAQKTYVEYDPAQVDLGSIAAAVHDAGYEVIPDELVLQIPGMRSAHCEGVVKQGVENLLGVARVEVNSNTGIAAVSYHGGIVSSAEIKQAIRDLGYEVSEKLEGQEALDQEREARRREIRRQGFWMLFSWPLAFVIMLGTFRDYW
ncbi:MAG: copper ion binding protein, partial [Deltaproteobacteria bacterium]|nr:copper ion binding protein [Deltaproteobacteria bacterium]